MKRFKKWVVDGVTEKWHECKANWRKSCSAAIAMICAIIVGILLLEAWDNTPATAQDYQPLEQQAEDFRNRFDLLIEEGKADDNITAIFKNDKCELSVKYDSESEEYTVTQKDNSVRWWMAAFLIFFVCFWIFNFIYATIGIIFICANKLCNVIRNAKDKRKNRI